MWDGQNGSGTGSNPAAIISSAALNDWQGLTALGSARIGDTASPTAVQPFDAQTVANGDIVVKFTYYGDANLDGVVDGNDTVPAGTGAAVWATGDYNYNGTRSATDSS